MTDLLSERSQVVLVEPRRVRDRAAELYDEEGSLASALGEHVGVPRRPRDHPAPARPLRPAARAVRRGGARHAVGGRGPDGARHRRARLRRRSPAMPPCSPARWSSSRPSGSPSPCARRAPAAPIGSPGCWPTRVWRPRWWAAPTGDPEPRCWWRPSRTGSSFPTPGWPSSPSPTSPGAGSRTARRDRGRGPPRASSTTWRRATSSSTASTASPATPGSRRARWPAPRATTSSSSTGGATACTFRSTRSTRSRRTPAGRARRCRRWAARSGNGRGPRRGPPPARWRRSWSSSTGAAS